MSSAAHLVPYPAARFTRWLVLALSLAALLPRTAAAAPTAVQVETLRQVAGVLDYIGGDYRGAVQADGTILDPGEYKEQRALADDAIALLSKAGIMAAADPLQARLQALKTALAARASPGAVEQLCQAAREEIVRGHGVDLAPSAVPSRELAQSLYRSQGCTTCHAEDGSAQTPTAAGLDPKPANFLDPERTATISPHRAYHAISHGVPGTAMTAYPKLSERERWSLAFYVLALRHQGRDLAAGERALETLHGAPPTDARALSERSDEQLERALTGIADAHTRSDALAYLRAAAPFRGAARGGMAKAHEQLSLGLAAYRKGDQDAARRAFISAYLDGVEPHEAALRARDGALVAELESTMLALRSAAAQGVPEPQLEAAVTHARELVSRAEHGRADASTAFVGALMIALREGVEIVLLVAALLGLVRKRGQPELVKFVHAGWLLAVPAGLATFWAAESVLSGMQRELAEGIASLLAALVLLGVTHWLLGQLGAKRWAGFLAKRVGAAVSSRRAALGVLSLSFVAAYREAFEVVLFFQALTRDAGSAKQVWFGAAAGLVLLCAFALVLLRVGQRLRPAPFMLVSSLCLSLLCFVMVGKGVHALQEAAALSLTLVPVPDAPWLGIYGSVESLVAQGLLTCMLLFSALWPKLNARRDKGELPAPAE
jgi:high-affinity iron transporter